MTRKVSRNYSLSVVAPFFAILTLLIAAAVLAQTSGAGQPTGKANAMLAPAGASAPAQAERPLISWTDGAGRFPVRRSQAKRHGARPMDENPLFLPAVTYNTGAETNPISFAVADVNGDAKPDIVVAIGSSPVNASNISVLLGNGDGTFQPAVTYAFGAYSIFVAIADVNGDNKPDLIVAGNDSVAVLLGNGDGTFQPAGSYPLCGGGNGFISLAVADVNGDRKPDLVVADGNCYSGVGVLLGNGDGTFRTPTSYYWPGGLDSSSITVADVNGDGKPDAVVAVGAYGSGAVGVLLGNGDGTLQPASAYDSGGFAAYSVAVADVNGDGKPDIIVTNITSVGVLLGNGDGTFQPVVSYDTNTDDSPSSVAVADVNSDGLPDILVANENISENSTVGVLLGNGDGTFQPELRFASGGVFSVWIAVADVNGDGLPDVLVANYISGTIGVLLHNDPTTTTVASSLNPSAYGQSVTFTATVTAASRTPTGTVIFYDGSTAIGSATLANGSASISTSALAAGSHSMTAAYQGSGAFSSSTSAPLIQVVNGVTTTTSLASSPNPSVYGQAVTFTAAVSSASGTPTGTVIFYDGSTQIGSATLVNGSASISISLLAAGSHSVTAAYQGSGVLQPSTSAPLNQVVNPATTTTSLASSANPARVKQRVTYTATVISQYGGASTGTVTFQDGGATIATVALSGNQAAYSTSYPKAGVHFITAVYSGDANDAGSTSPVLTEDIGKPPFPSVTTLATSGSPSLVGQPATFTATVTSTHGTIPDGELVTFYDGTTAIGTGVTASGVATFTTSSLTAKTHTIKATYAGDANFKPSSGSVTQVVDKYTTTTALNSSLNPSNHGQAVTFTATVTSAGPYAPTGSVRFMDGTTTLGSAKLSGGVAKLTKSTLAVGTHPITAQYMGDADSAVSTSPVLDQVVQ